MITPPHVVYFQNNSRSIHFSLWVLKKRQHAPFPGCDYIALHFFLTHLGWKALLASWRGKKVEFMGVWNWTRVKPELRRGRSEGWLWLAHWDSRSLLWHPTDACLFCPLLPLCSLWREKLLLPRRSLHLLGVQLICCSLPDSLLPYLHSVGHWCLWWTRSCPVVELIAPPWWWPPSRTSSPDHWVQEWAGH